MRRAWLVLICGVWLAVVGGITISAQNHNPGGGAGGTKIKNPVATSPESIAAGQAAFAKNCRFCHGDDAKGNGKLAPKDSHPPDLTDTKWDHGSTDGEIFAVIRDGAGPESVMKGYNAKIPEPDIWNIVNYLRSLGPQTKK